MWGREGKEAVGLGLREGELKPVRRTTMSSGLQERSEDKNGVLNSGGIASRSFEPYKRLTSICFKIRFTRPTSTHLWPLRAGKGRARLRAGNLSPRSIGLEWRGGRA